MFKRFKTNINILGRDMKVIFHSGKETFDKDLEGITSAEKTDGICNLKKNEIHLAMHRYIDNEINFEKIIRIFYHEIGHIIEYYGINSTIDGEWISSMFEFIPPIAIQVEKIIKELKKRTNND